jgi:UDP-glucuronate decarboxylase
LNAMTAMMNNESGFVWPVNTGSQFEFTMKELAETIIKLIPWNKSKIIYAPLPGDDPKQRRANNTLANEKLQWEPKIQLEEGLTKTIEYFKKFA